MIRQFALVILDKEDNIIDRFNLDHVSNISGLGFVLDIKTIDTDLISFVTKVTQSRSDVSLSITFEAGYTGSNLLRGFVEKYIYSNMALEYNDTKTTTYADIKVNTGSWTELDVYKHLVFAIKFKTLTPFYTIDKNVVRVSISSYGKTYPLNYPYSYGTNIDENNEIENTYIADIPLIVSITGTIQNPVIALSDDTGVYASVSFVDTNLLQGEQIIISAVTKKIYKINQDGTIIDYYYNVSADSDKYLYVRRQSVSNITVNLQAGDTGVLTASRRQYRL